MSAEAAKKRYDKLKSLGKCTYCGEPLLDRDGAKCEKCAKKHLDYHKKRYADKQTREKIELLNYIRRLVGYDE